MLTLDVWLVARLALELRARLTGARVQGAKSDAGGLALSCYRRGEKLRLRVTIDGPGALLAVHGVSDEKESGPGGWAGGVMPLLRGSAIETVQAVPNDRIIFVDLVSRSAFGVPARRRIVVELEPNKPNILITRPDETGGWQIVAAAREIHGARGARDVLAGHPYEAPPPRRATLDRAAFRAAVKAMDEPDARALVRLLGGYDPTCSAVLAQEIIGRVAADPRGGDRALALLAAWEPLRAEVECAASSVEAPAYAWRQPDGSIRVCHVVRLAWPAGEPTVEDSLNTICARAQSRGDRDRYAPAIAAVRKRLGTMLERGAKEAAGLERALTRATDAEADRLAGEAIYTYLAQIPAGADVFVTPDGARIALDPLASPKENAAAYFRRFKKARSGLPHIKARLEVLRANRAHWEDLAWQLDAVDGAPPEEIAGLLEEIADAAGGHRGKRPSTRRLAGARVVQLAGGAVAHVGRSPKDNERVTFSVGSPNDLWFHARGVPGAHVILKTSNPREEPTVEQILGAAALAAGQSRAADAGAVDVDYTRRKHVRKQGGGRVGLVWYTDFQTVRVAPRKL